MEFKHVFLGDVNERTLPTLPSGFNELSNDEQQLALRTEKALFYVASSRAIHRLVISGVGSKSELIEEY